MASGPMILKCSHCGGMMKVDEAKVPPNRKFKVRCPHCQNVDVVSGEFVGLQGSPVGPLATPTAQQPLVPPPTAAHDSGPALAPSQPQPDIHFPADEQDEPPARNLMSRKARLICWAVGSLLWVALFALLVNLILPGPYGGSPVTGLPPQVDDASSPATGVLTHPAGRPGLSIPAAR